MAVLDLHCCKDFSQVGVSGGYSLVVVLGFLLLWSRGFRERMGSVVAIPKLERTGSVVVAHGLNCSEASGIFLDQGSNPYLLYWQGEFFFFFFFLIFLFVVNFVIH